MESTTEQPHSESSQSNCLSRWWNQNFSHQKRLASFLEHPLFHLLITILVIVECASVIIEILLHSVKRQYECNSIIDFSKQYLQTDIHKLEHGMEICHYVSLTILSIFLFEILLKIYSLGYHYWNCKENYKLDYFDAILVIFSFTVEIYFFSVDKKSFLAHLVLLIVILRLWHIIRIANATIRCFQNGEEFKTYRRGRHSKKSSETLLIPPSIQAVLDLMQEKTECLRHDITIEQPLVDRFEAIDKKCQDAFEDYHDDETKLVEEIEKLHLIARKLQKEKNYLIHI